MKKIDFKNEDLEKEIDNIRNSNNNANLISEINNLNNEMKTKFDEADAKINRIIEENRNNIDNILRLLPKQPKIDDDLDLYKDNDINTNSQQNNDKNNNNQNNDNIDNNNNKNNDNTWNNNNKENEQLIDELLKDDNKFCTALTCKYCTEIEKDVRKLELKIKDLDEELTNNDNKFIDIYNNIETLKKYNVKLNEKVNNNIKNINLNNNLINNNNVKEINSNINLKNDNKNINTLNKNLNIIQNLNIEKKEKEKEENLNIFLNINDQYIKDKILKKLKKHLKFLKSEDGINLKKRKGISKISIDTFTLHNDLALVKRKLIFNTKKSDYFKNKKRKKYETKVLEKKVWKSLVNFTLEDNLLSDNQLRFSYRFDNNDNIIIIDDISNKEIKKLCRYCLDTHEGEICPNIFMYLNNLKIKWTNNNIKEICPLCGYSHNVFKIQKIRQCNILSRAIGLALLLNCKSFNEQDKLYINEDDKLLKTVEDIIEILINNKNLIKSNYNFNNIWLKNRKLTDFILDNYHNFIQDRNDYKKKKKLNQLLQLGNSNGKFRNNIDDTIVFMKEITKLFYENEYKNSKQKILDDIKFGKNNKNNGQANNKFIFSIQNNQIITYKKGKKYIILDRFILNILFWNFVNIETTNRLYRRLNERKIIKIIFNNDNNIIKKTYNRNLLIKKLHPNQVNKNLFKNLILGEINELLELRNINSNGDEKKYQTRYINRLSRKYEDLCNKKKIIPIRREYYVYADLKNVQNEDISSSSEEEEEENNIQLSENIKKDLKNFQGKKEPRKDNKVIQNNIENNNKIIGQNDRMLDENEERKEEEKKEEEKKEDNDQNNNREDWRKEDEVV